MLTGRSVKQSLPLTTLQLTFAAKEGKGKKVIQFRSKRTGTTPHASRNELTDSTQDKACRASTRALDMHTLGPTGLPTRLSSTTSTRQIHTCHPVYVILPSTIVL